MIFSFLRFAKHEMQRSKGAIGPNTDESLNLLHTISTTDPQTHRPEIKERTNEELERRMEHSRTLTRTNGSVFHFRDPPIHLGTDPPNDRMAEQT